MQDIFLKAQAVSDIAGPGRGKTKRAGSAVKARWDQGKTKLAVKRTTQCWRNIDTDPISIHSLSVIHYFILYKCAAYGNVELKAWRKHTHTDKNNIIRSYSILVEFCQHQDLKSRDRGRKCRAESGLRQYFKGRDELGQREFEKQARPRTEEICLKAFLQPSILLRTTGIHHFRISTFIGMIFKF